jgi:hypothetical protein
MNEFTTSAASAAPTASAEFPAAVVIEDTVRWLEKAVIDLNLCPFAKAVHVKGQIHYVVSEATDAEGVALDLHRELEALAEAPALQRDTTLLIVPQALQDFLDFNDFLELADNLIDDLDLGGILQVASFHPQFQFDGTEIDDVTNCTNRAPYPILHLLREDSIDKAVEAFPEAETIYERNMEVLEKLGIEGWLDLGVGARCPITGHGAAKVEAEKPKTDPEAGA